MDGDAGIGALENSDTFRDDDYTRSEVFSFTAGVDYRINDDFSLSNTSRYYRYDLDRNNTLADSSPARFVTAANGELLVKLNCGNVQRKEDGWFNQTELNRNGTWPCVCAMSSTRTITLRCMVL